MRRYLERARARDPRISVVPGDPLPHLQRARLCVHPAYEDGFGYAPAEALACGVPVIVTEDTGMKELIDRRAQRRWWCPRASSTVARGGDRRRLPRRALAWLTARSRTRAGARRERSPARRSGRRPSGMSRGADLRVRDHATLLAAGAGGAGDVACSMHWLGRDPQPLLRRRTRRSRAWARALGRGAQRRAARRGAAALRELRLRPPRRAAVPAPALLAALRGARSPRDGVRCTSSPIRGAGDAARERVGARASVPR